MAENEQKLGVLMDAAGIETASFAQQSYINWLYLHFLCAKIEWIARREAAAQIVFKS